MVSTQAAMAPDQATLAASAPGSAGRTGTAPRSAWSRFRRHPPSMLGLGFLLACMFMAIAAPLVAPHNPVSADLATSGAFRQAAWVDDPSPMRAGTWTYPLGTDGVGRDVLSRLVYGARVSLLIGIVPVLLILLIGVPAGFVAGYFGGRADTWIMRVADVIYSFPALLFFIVIQVSLVDTGIGKLFNGLFLLFLALSILNWSSVARLMRSETLTLREMDFVLAARAGGSAPGPLIRRHIFPNAIGPMIVMATYLAPGAIISEAILSYLGIGLRPVVRPDAPLPTSWGMMIFDGSRVWQSQLWMLIAPTIAIALLTLAFSAIGDALRDALDTEISQLDR